MNWTAISAIATSIGTAIVGWYTWETHRLRLISQKQVDVSQKQLDSLTAAIQPHFVFQPPSLQERENKLILTVATSGGQARNLMVASDTVRILIQSPLLDDRTGAPQHWDVFPLDQQSNINEVQFDFCINFEDQHGALRSQSFRRTGRKIERIESATVS